MKTIFLSHPMQGIDPIRQLQIRREMTDKLKEMYSNEELKFIHAADCPVKHGAGIIYYLGQAISQIDICDAVAFSPGYKDSKECLAERVVAELYEKEVITL